MGAWIDFYTKQWLQSNQVDKNPNVEFVQRKSDEQVWRGHQNCQQDMKKQVFFPVFWKVESR